MKNERDRLLDCKYGLFVSTICNGSNNPGIGWDSMRAALLRVINSEGAPFKVEELPHAAHSIIGRDRMAMLLGIYEIVEPYIQLPKGRPDAN